MLHVHIHFCCLFSRHKLRQVDKCCNHNALKLFRLCNQRSNLRQVYQKLKLISTVHKTQPTIQLLLRTSDFVGALDLITTTQEVLQQELQGVQALRYSGKNNYDHIFGCIIITILIVWYVIGKLWQNYL